MLYIRTGTILISDSEGDQSGNSWSVLSLFRHRSSLRADGNGCLDGVRKHKELASSLHTLPGNIGREILIG
jgi:hypothetical protein